MRIPTFRIERELVAAGHVPVGVDEVGCGCLAGPVVAAAMVLPLASRQAIVRDSKTLSAAQRERIVAEFAARGYSWGIGVSSAVEIDAVNIRNATLLAMRRAVEQWLIVCARPTGMHQSTNGTALTHNTDPRMARIPRMRVQTGSHSICGIHDTRGFVHPGDRPCTPFALVDAWTIPDIPIPQRAIVHGDALVKSIAAASIVAKVVRDRMMRGIGRAYPVYGFERHKGYGTAEHYAAISHYGCCAEHRKTFIHEQTAADGKSVQ